MSRRVACTLAVIAGLTLWVAPSARASNDPGFDRQWGLPQIGAPTAWARATGSGVKVGIVDSGVDLAHEDLAGAIVASTSCIGSSGNPAACSGSAQDDDGHGTHVAGIIGARKDNGKGVAGVAPNAQLVIARALEHYEDLTSEGASGSTSDINAAIKWVVDRGARVVNLSLGGDVVITNIFGSGLTEGVEYAWSKGAVPVLASGNTNYFGLGSANYGNTNALVVAAVGPEGRESWYSSPPGNAKWGLAAPGGDSDDCAVEATAPRCILSTFWQPGSSGRTYGFQQGTSMAAPHVSGTLAAIFQQNPGFTAQQAVDRIMGTLARADCGSGCKGRLDMANAVGAGATPPPPPSVPGVPPPKGGAGGSGGGRSTPRSTAPRRTTAPRTSGTTVPAAPGETTTSTSAPEAYVAADLGSDDSSPPKVAVRLPEENDDDGVPVGVAALGGLGVLGAGGATALVIRGRGGAAAVLEALRPGGGP